VAEIESPHDGAQVRVRGDVGQEFVKDPGVGNRDLAVQGTEGRNVQRPRGPQQRHQVNIASRQAIGGHIDNKEADDGA
jgi:hypothetical protein